MKEKQHYLIVGAGLSGLCVSAQLIKKGVNVTLVDNEVNHCSRVAAGMINPLVFRRMTKSWRVDEFMPYLRSFYKELEKNTNSSFFHFLQIRRMFSNDHERDLWLKKQGDSAFSNYMHSVTADDEKYDKALNPFGSGRVKGGCYVDTAVFLNVVKSWVVKKGAVLTEDFDYSAVENTNYRGKEYTGIIFCEGYKVKHNPWFGDLPINQTKGEMLTIRSSSIPENESINRKCFILPLGNNLFRTGSTHEWHTATLNITDEGRRIILDKVDHITHAPVEVVDQEAGVRPTVLDRRPIIGVHNEHPGLYIFNGLGTKGYMMAPLLSREFADYLIDGIPLNEETRIARFQQYP